MLKMASTIQGMMMWVSREERLRVPESYMPPMGRICSLTAKR